MRERLVTSFSHRLKKKLLFFNNVKLNLEQQFGELNEFK